MQKWIFCHFTEGLWATGIAGFLALFLMIPLSADGRLVTMVVILPMVLWGVLAIAATYAVYRAALHDLDEGCDPGPLEEIARIEIDRTRSRTRKTTYLNHWVNLTAALSARGDYHAALDALRRAEECLPANPGVFHVVCALNEGAAYCQLARPQEAAACLARAEQLSQVVTRKLPANIDYFLRINRCAVRLLEEGASAALETEYQVLLTQADTLRAKLHIRLALGKCALARGDENQARTHFEYVAARANRLALCDEARQLLAALSADPTSHPGT